MINEYGLYRSQLKGYLFEIIIMELLRKNKFTEINVSTESRDRVRETREGFIEFKGRGCWHQIDCPCDYCGQIPFSYPLRLLVEVKFYKTPLEKKHIRGYIGIIKDIQENYFVADGINPQNLYPRKMEIGVYFSASGFQAEAEKLAYAHGIKTVSYENNYLLDRIKTLIDELEKNYLSVKCMKNNIWNSFRQELIQVIRYGHLASEIRYRNYWADGYMRVLDNIHKSLVEIKSSFIATTVTGVFLHFVSAADFPVELFQESDRGSCTIHYEYDNFGNRFFWMEISGDDSHRRFFFTPPESLDQASVYGHEIVLNEKERIFKVLNVTIELNGVVRNLTLSIDEDWLDLARNNA